jgi:hypothetical protein
LTIKKIRYVNREKSSGNYLAKQGEYYCDGELCQEIEYANFWIDDEDAEEYRKNCLDEPNDFEIVKVIITYEIKN